MYNSDISTSWYRRGSRRSRGGFCRGWSDNWLSLAIATMSSRMSGVSERYFLTDVIRNYVGPKGRLIIQVWPSVDRSTYGPFYPFPSLYTSTSPLIRTPNVSLVLRPFRYLRASLTCRFIYISTTCFMAFLMALPRSVTVAKGYLTSSSGGMSRRLKGLVQGRQVLLYYSQPWLPFVGRIACFIRAVLW
jgi:hypothetical protein